MPWMPGCCASWRPSRGWACWSFLAGSGSPGLRPRPAWTGWSSGGVIASFAPRIEPEALGYGVTAFATLEIRQGAGAAVLRHLADIPEVLEVHTITGQGDMLCRLVARSNADLQHVIDRVNGNDAIVRTSTVIAMANPVPHRVLPLVHRAEL